MKTCNNCKKEFDNSFLFCPFCGYKNEPPVSAENPPLDHDNLSSSTEEIEETRNKKSKLGKFEIFSLIFLGSIILFCIVFYLLVGFFGITKTECEKHGHQYGEEVVIDPTCSEMGYASKVCKICNEESRSNYKSELGHQSAIQNIRNFEYKELNTCKRCNEKLFGLRITHAVRKSTSYSSNYYYFEGTLKNEHIQSFTYVKAKLIIYDKNGKVIHTDWTYAVDSMALEVGESITFDIMVNKSYCQNMSYFRFELYN